MQDNSPSDHRPESRKIKFETIRTIREASFGEIEELLKKRITCIEELEKLGPTVQSLGVVKPLEVLDFAPVPNAQYKKLVTKSAQLDLFGNSAVKLDIPEYKYQYIFKDDVNGRVHELLCEDWEVGELYRNCEAYREGGRYKDENEVHRKVRQKMLDGINVERSYFIVGSHSRFPTYMIVGVVYPRKEEMK